MQFGYTMARKRICNSLTQNDFLLLIFSPYQAICLPYIGTYHLGICDTRATHGPEQGMNMAAYNKNFELSVEDIELIETALRDKKRDLSEQAHEGHCAIRNEVQVCDETTEEVREIHDLLGRIHNQKVFYRPRSQPYIGG